MDSNQADKIKYWKESWKLSRAFVNAIKDKIPHDERKVKILTYAYVIDLLLPKIYEHMGSDKVPSHDLKEKLLLIYQQQQDFIETSLFPDIKKIYLEKVLPALQERRNNKCALDHSMNKKNDDMNHSKTKGEPLEGPQKKRKKTSHDHENASEGSVSPLPASVLKASSEQAVSRKETDGEKSKHQESSYEKSNHGAK